jgi:hypothetical protein
MRALPGEPVEVRGVRPGVMIVKMNAIIRLAGGVFGDVIEQTRRALRADEMSGKREEGKIGEEGRTRT